MKREAGTRALDALVGLSELQSWGDSYFDSAGNKSLLFACMLIILCPVFLTHTLFKNKKIKIAINNYDSSKMSSITSEKLTFSASGCFLTVQSVEHENHVIKSDKFPLGFHAHSVISTTALCHSLQVIFLSENMQLKLKQKHKSANYR